MFSENDILQGFGIHPHQVVLNFLASQHLHFVDDQELNPIAYAEQFADPDPLKAQPPEELLTRARMLLSTEIGKDPLLRNEFRKLYREEAQITVEPTERGVSKIDERHPYFVSLSCVVRRNKLMPYSRISNTCIERTLRTCWNLPNFSIFSPPKPSIW